MATNTPRHVKYATPFRLPCRHIQKLAMAAMFLAAACSSEPERLVPARDLSDQSAGVNRGITRAFPQPGQSRQTRKRPGYDITGTASWYGRRYHGRQTASGEIFDMNAPTAAHRTLPFGSRVHITNLANGRSVTVRINDRGPFVGRRIIDVSQGVAQVLGFIRQGTTQVRVRLLERGG